MKIWWVLLLLVACAQSVPMERGVVVSPREMDTQGLDEFFELSDTAGLVGWSGDWLLLEEENSAPHVVAKLAEEHGYTPVVSVQFFTQRNGSLLRPLSEITRQRYVKSAADFAARYLPEYFGVGVEVNEYYTRNPDAFDQFVSLFHETRDAVKSVSPETKVFTSFQLERMKGGGGLFAETTKPQWDLISLFDADLVAFTTYPNLLFEDPSDIPFGYYREIDRHVDAFAFSEVGWHSGNATWPSTEQEQAEFVDTFLQLASGEFALWVHVFDQDYAQPFDTMGLRDDDGSPRQAWEAWS